MTKAEIKSKINTIPFEMLQPAVYAIERSNPMNVFTRNRTYICRSTRGRYCTAIEIDFQTRATKENMMNVYHAILDQILCIYDIAAVHAIDPGYTPAWYQEPAEEAEEIPAEEATLSYNEYLERAKNCVTVSAAESLINQAADDYTLSARQYFNIRHIAIETAYGN